MYPSNYKAYGLTSFLIALTPVINEDSFIFFDNRDKITLSFYYKKELNNEVVNFQAHVYKHRNSPYYCNVVEVDQGKLEDMLNNSDNERIINTLKHFQRQELVAGRNKPPKYDHCYFRKSGQKVKIEREGHILKDICKYPENQQEKKTEKITR